MVAEPDYCWSSEDQIHSNTKGPPAPRNVLVTGGSSGIGRDVVRRFSRAGDRVWFTYLTGHERAASLLVELDAEGFAEARGFEFSQGDWLSHEDLLARLPGPVDVLVNNSAVGTKTIEKYVQGPAHARDEAFFQINSIGPLWLFRALLPGMLDRGYGKVVHISSVGGGIAQFPGFDVADGMSKAALTYLTRHTAAELAHAPVEVFAVCPGAVDTGMFQASTLDPLTPQRRQALVDGLPKGRLIEPAEIAELVWWLCGEQARVLHGAVIDASMGLGVHPALLAGRAAALPDGTPALADGAAGLADPAASGLAGVR
jgi:NAD(P)-dependent dehydrogenase (short-subunit alcohol dehydrogenase family)